MSTQFICVVFGSLNTQRLYPFTSLHYVKSQMTFSITEHLLCKPKSSPTFVFKIQTNQLKYVRDDLAHSVKI